jgi:hypothetical protein
MDNKKLHRAYVLSLFLLGILATIVLGIHGASYYLSPEVERPFHTQYDSLKPTGFLGHGYGIVGTSMVLIGVVLYSSRKRVKSLGSVGKIKYFLEFHIFLCLLGPILILYHTTFKFGGLVSVSFWSMSAVVVSGVIGRYIYVQIPKGIQGNELSIADLQIENHNLADELMRRFGVPREIIAKIDAIAMPSRAIRNMSTFEVINFFLLNDLLRRSRLRQLFGRLEGRGLTSAVLARMKTLAMQRITLTRRIAFLEKFKELFHLWHVIHLPFSVVMGIILFVHVGVAIAFGYTWIW